MPFTKCQHPDLPGVVAELAEPWGDWRPVDPKTDEPTAGLPDGVTKTGSDPGPASRRRRRAASSITASPTQE